MPLENPFIDELKRYFEGLPLPEGHGNPDDE